MKGINQMVEGEYLKPKWDGIEGKMCNMQVSRSVVMEGKGLLQPCSSFPGPHSMAQLSLG